MLNHDRIFIRYCEAWIEDTLLVRLLWVEMSNVVLLSGSIRSIFCQNICKDIFGKKIWKIELNEINFWFYVHKIVLFTLMSSRYYNRRILVILQTLFGNNCSWQLCQLLFVVSKDKLGQFFFNITVPFCKAPTSSTPKYVFYLWSLG